MRNDPLREPRWQPAWAGPLEPPRPREIVENPHNEFLRYLVVPAVLHIPLVLGLSAFPSLGLVYVLILVVIGLVQLRKEEPDGLLLVCGYISSAELIWRMTSAPVFWETGKYLLVFLMGLGIFRWKVKLAGKPVLYFLLLVPSIIVTLNMVSLSSARDYVSFNLSGPLLIAVSAVFFNGISMKRKIFQRFLLLSIVPITAIWMLAFRSTLAGGRIQFTNYSNFATSGGYGPNQVSAVLGLGVLFCWLYLFIARPTGRDFWLLGGIGLALLTQAILTFSRGGIVNLAVAIPLASFFFTSSKKKVQQRLFAVFLLAGFALIILIPRLDQFTGGMLITRFENFSLTGREQIMRADLQLWQENPIFGVGVGISSLLRGEMASLAVLGAATHTEYTRLLAEHGYLGLGSILLLLSMVWQAFHQARGGLARGTVLGLAAWALTEMAHAAMRIASISFVLTLPLAHLDLADE
ncbi:MAG: O-antigen ligase family protein [Anaerolineales bacterium]|jgi:O-antigen ligase|nr:O-antigen ligase family protein [Anaerolineales bacterium]